jgi:hypothetical protein
MTLILKLLQRLLQEFEAKMQVSSLITQQVNFILNHLQDVHDDMLHMGSHGHQIKHLMNKQISGCANAGRCIEARVCRAALNLHRKGRQLRRRKSLKHSVGIRPYCRDWNSDKNAENEL